MLNTPGPAQENLGYISDSVKHSEENGMTPEPCRIDSVKYPNDNSMTPEPARVVEDDNNMLNTPGPAQENMGYISDSVKHSEENGMTPEPRRIVKNDNTPMMTPGPSKTEEEDDNIMTRRPNKKLVFERFSLDITMAGGQLLDTSTMSTAGTSSTGGRRRKRNRLHLDESSILSDDSPTAACTRSALKRKKTDSNNA